MAGRGRITVSNSVTVAPESDIDRRLARRAVLVAPVFLLVGVLGWGLDGLLSSALALVLVAVNFRLGAAIITRAAQISINALYGAVLGGYVVRLAMMTAVVLIVKAAGLLATVPFAITLLVTHLGLLAWESRHVAMTLAAPGLRPTK